jgi:hypothetical protein
MTIYDSPVIVNSSLHLAASSGNVIAGLQVSAIYLFNRDILLDEEFMGAYVTYRSAPPVSAAASNSNSKPPQTYTCTSKEETHPSSPEDIRPVSKAGRRKIQNVNKKKRTTNILTDTQTKML